MGRAAQSREVAPPGRSQQHLRAERQSSNAHMYRLEPLQSLQVEMRAVIVAQRRLDSRLREHHDKLHAQMEQMLLSRSTPPLTHREAPTVVATHSATQDT